MDRNQELLTRIRQLQEREAEAEEKMKEQLERYRLCQQSLDAASRKLREEEDSLAEAGEVSGCDPTPAGAPAPGPAAPARPEGASVLDSASPSRARVFCIAVIVAKIPVFHSVVSRE